MEWKKQKHLKYQNFSDIRLLFIFSTNSLYWYIIQRVKLMLLMKLHYLHYLSSKYLNRMLIKWRVRNEIGTFVFIILNDHFFTGKKIRVQQYLFLRIYNLLRLLSVVKRSGWCRANYSIYDTRHLSLTFDWNESSIQLQDYQIVDKLFIKDVSDIQTSWKNCRYYIDQNYIVFKHKAFAFDTPRCT